MKKIARKRFLLAGGGTGGHIYPALSICRELLARYPDADILFVGGKRGLESDLVPKAGFKFRAITVSGFERRFSLDTLATAGRAVAGLFQSIAIVRKFRPNAAVGTGGYASGPAMLAAAMLGVPVVIHEQNVVPGATNRLLSKWAQTVAVSWEESKKYLARPERSVLTGNPIRPEIVTAEREESAASFGLDPRRPTVLAFGGSQGARRINTAFIGTLPSLAAQYNAQFMLATGSDKFEESMDLVSGSGLRVSISSDGIGRSDSGDIIIMPYIYNMPKALACADLAICRAGAITIAELAARGVPALLVPHPHVPDNVQEKNARAMEARGAARVILDAELDSTVLESEVGSLLSSERALRGMAEIARSSGRPDAARKVADCVIRAAQGVSSKV
jgi:UDP-N-acetylglucosamine--N-acetylmuramyl-(pentapeptide) pyrophosphoryl-undecaprenol N-acetylglucosamine transferase